MAQMMAEQIPNDLFAHYQRLQQYVGWTAEDERHIRQAAPLVRPAFDWLVDDFYRAIMREPETARLITGGQTQIRRLKGTLRQWLDQLLTGPYDRAYAERRWRVGRRHMEIGLRQVYADVAMARLRAGILEALRRNWTGSHEDLAAVSLSINRLLDLELALIEDAYTTERLVEQRREVKQQSEATFRNLVETAHCVIVILREDHTIAYFSPFAEQLTGYRAEEVVGRDYFETFLPAEVRAGVAEEIRRVMAGGYASVDYENPILTREGEQRMILWNAQRLEDYEGQPGVLAVGHDVTDLKKAQQKLVQSERLAAIGQMMAGLAHESRNAFQRSQACLEMLALEVEDRPEALQLVERVQRALDHIHQLYEEVRGYAAPIRLEPTPCDIAHVWRTAWAHLDVARKNKSVELVEQIPDGLDLVCAVDEFALGQVFRNILENAIAACGDPARIVIRCAPCSLDHRPAVRVEVHDSGPGFSEEALRRVFEPFFTTKTKGTGLGMAIAHRIVQAHGGTIRVANDPAGGAVVALVLPRAAS